jgi:hypothetical protein
MKTPGLICKTLLAAAIGLPMTAANATVIDFYNGANLYAQMTTGGGTSFSLNFVGTGVAAGGYISELFLDGPIGTFTNTNAGVASFTGTYALNSYNGGGGQGNIYDWYLNFSNANNSGRLDIGETATWTITVTDPSAWTIDKLHLNAFDAAGGSIKLDGCIDGSAGCGGGGGVVTTVPEPGSLVLAGLALLGVGVARRRRA